MEYGGDVDEVVSLYRQHNGQPWGFRMMGGRDQGCCLYIAKVKRGSLAAKSGLHAGDAVLQIGPVPATHLNHEHAKAEILRAGNDLHLLVRRNAVQVPPEPEPERSQVVEEGTRFRGEKDMKAQSRCFRIMTDALVEELHAKEQSNPGTNKVVRFA